ncbi:uncharacterized protein BJX67DRAFT_366448 [Aspergillus lucknowensis]|uniref:Uncharacterized protein n=1 Tax=Aspergillus lucknowensis TaxID=176173 RepID=A0ABR4LCZ9_9EURO
MPLPLAFWGIPLFLFASRVLGKEDVNYDPDSNYRPRNVTGLDYYYYPWRGSYYNGSAIFTVSDVVPRDEDDELCSRLQNVTYTFSYPALLAVTQPEDDDERPENTNPVDLTFITSYSNFTKYFSGTDSTNMAIRDMPFDFQSIEISRYAYPGYGDPTFNLTLASGSGNGSPFRVTGASELEQNPLPAMEMNMTSCVEPVAWWSANFASEDWDDDDLGVTNPTLQLTFDGASANLRVESWVFANTLHARVDDREEDPTPAIAARMSIEFLGRVDAARSDVLNGEGSEPSWTPTLGFGNNSLNLDFESGGVGLGGGGLRGLVWASFLGVAVVYFSL